MCDGEYFNCIWCDAVDDSIRSLNHFQDARPSEFGDDALRIGYPTTCSVRLVLQLAACPKNRVPHQHPIRKVQMCASRMPRLNHYHL